MTPGKPLISTLEPKYQMPSKKYFIANRIRANIATQLKEDMEYLATKCGERA